MRLTFFERQGDAYLQGIKEGTLHVKYSSGETRTYGNGNEPFANLQIYDARFFRRLFLYGDIGFAESYMDGDFSSSDLTKLITLALMNSKTLATKSDDQSLGAHLNLASLFNKAKHWLNRNTLQGSRKNISRHYDLSNDFFALMLDESMMYSSAVFAHEEEPLFAAQQRKISLLADKLRIQPGAKVLEIGSGWGAMATHLAKERGCEVTTVTLSKEQKALCEARFANNGVDERIDIMLKDYRHLEGKFDAIIAIEMFEAVGQPYFKTFFQKCESLLKVGGVMAMQIITMPDQRYDAYAKGTDFIQKYIFPGGHLPSVSKILQTTQQATELNLQHMEEFTEDYAKTLNLWHHAFIEKLDQVKALGFDDVFIRMWQMYLNYCEAAFLTRNINLVQLVFTRQQNMALNRGLVA